MKTHTDQDIATTARSSTDLVSGHLNNKNETKNSYKKQALHSLPKKLTFNITKL